MDVLALVPLCKKKSTNSSVLFKRTLRNAQCNSVGHYAAQ